MKNIQLQQLIKNLKRQSIDQDVRLWKRIATDLEKSSRNRRVVNLYKIDQFAKEGELILVPGKVLGIGELSKKLTIAAYQFSEKAKTIINKKGKTMSISQLMKDNPKGLKVRIIG